MHHKISIILLLVFSHLGVFGQEPPKVTLDNLGTLVGTEITTRGGRIIHGFQGIPFAESPSGANRFQAPVTKSWSGELDASQSGTPCVQIDFAKLKRNKRDLIWDLPISNNFSLADPEDCLSLNVFTPDLTHSKQLPVVVFFHGGSFVSGSSSKFRPEFLLDRDVILVVPQYRLGPFGFLSMQNEIIPGNAGLLDTVEALRWVQNHIAKFGGNKNQVTVFGQSAGAAIANFLLLSPLSKGLIHGVIGNSGSPLAPWALDNKPTTGAKAIATLAGCLGNEEMISQCLRDLTAEKLLNAYTLYSNMGGLSGALPCINRADEPEATNFLPMDPADIIEKGKYEALPMMAGANRHDSMWMVNILNSILKATNLTNNEFFIKHMLTHKVVEFGGMRDPAKIITDMMESKYLSYVAPDNRANFTELVPGILDFITTVTMKAPGYRMVQLNSKRANSFWYAFDYQGRYHLPSNGINDPGGLFTEGSTHSDDIIYLTPRIDDPFNEEEANLSQLMVDLWANFITSGNPSLPKVMNPAWPKYTQQDDHYYEINKEPRVKTDYTFQYKAAIKDFVKSSSQKLQISMFLWMIVGVALKLVQ